MSKLKTKRMETGISQSQLADKANMNVRTLQHYEQQTKIFDNARIDTILRVCLALKCKMEDVIENPKYIELLRKYESS